MGLAVACDRGLGIAQFAHRPGKSWTAGLVALLPTGHYADYLTSVEFDGVPSSLRNPPPELRRMVEEAGVPVVDLGQTQSELPLPRVVADHRAAGRLAAGHLLDLGLRRPLFYSHAVGRQVAPTRRDGFVERATPRSATVEQLWWDIRTHGRAERTDRSG